MLNVRSLTNGKEDGQIVTYVDSIAELEELCNNYSSK